MRKRPLTAAEIEAPGQIQIKNHEGAIVCSLQQRVSGNRETLNNLVRDTISSLASWTAAQGGLVGHIKATLQIPTGTLIYSCTGDEVQIREIPDSGELLELTVIVFLVDEDQLKRRMEQFLDQLQ